MFWLNLRAYLCYVQNSFLWNKIPFLYKLTAKVVSLIDYIFFFLIRLDFIPNLLSLYIYIYENKYG